MTIRELTALYLKSMDLKESSKLFIENETESKSNGKSKQRNRCHFAYSANLT